MWPLCLISTSHAHEPCRSRLTQNSAWSRFEFGYLSPVFKFLGVSFKAIGRQMGYHYTVVSLLGRKHTQNNNVKDLPRSGRPRVTSDRDDRVLQRLVRRMPFATSPALKQHWLPKRRLSKRTVRNRLKSARLKSRRVIKRPLLANRHRRTRMA